MRHEKEVCDSHHVRILEAPGRPRLGAVVQAASIRRETTLIAKTKMIANSLKTEIENYAARLLRSSRLFRQAQQGAVTPRIVGTYLFNLRYLFRNNVTHLQLACKESEARGWPALAEYYATKALEEQGHDAWADSDLTTVKRQHDVMLPSAPSPAMADLLDYLQNVISTEPQRYVAYTLLAEYLTVLAGPAWMQALDQQCGIPPSSLTAIGRHIELDREHVSEGFSQIDELIAPRELPGLTETLLCSMRYFERFFDEISAVDN